MKTFIASLIILLCYSRTVTAQSAIEKKTSGNSSVLDFATGTTKGIILPAVQVLPTTPANGTFLLDKTDQKIKMFQNGSWIDLSTAGSIAAVVPYSGISNGKKTIIGSLTSSADGILVLESPNKALVLPNVANPQLTVKSPYPGMMCYDTVSKSLAVFDGKLWNFWK